MTAPAQPWARTTAAPDAVAADIVVEGLARRFGRREVLRDVSFHVPAGSFLLLLGHNGAGKTTLLRVLAGLLTPSAGRVTVAGHDVRAQAAAMRRRVGYVAHQPLVYDDLTARENLWFFARLYGVEDAPSRVDGALERLELLSQAGERSGDLSLGMRQRLAIARALVHGPSVLLLDEPYAGLDERGAMLLDGVLQNVAGAVTVVLVTHRPSRPARWADEALVLRHGRAEAAVVPVPNGERARPSGSV